MPEHRHDAVLLIVHIVLASYCAWQHRFTPLAQDFPHVLLRIAEKHHSAICQKRKDIAKELLAQCAHCLEGKTSDLAFKLRKPLVDVFVVFFSFLII